MFDPILFKKMNKIADSNEKYIYQSYRNGISVVFVFLVQLFFVYTCYILIKCYYT